MQVDLTGLTAALLGDEGILPQAAMAALEANGARLAASPSAVPDILIVAYPLIPTEALDAQPLLSRVQPPAEQMYARHTGRILFLLSAAAAVPMRRHAHYSAQMATAWATLRALAMRMGPHVLVNGVGIGVIGDEPIAGDKAMLTHTATGRPGAIEDVTDAVLFLADPANSYTDGQLLVVDGGWSAGYGRNF